LQIGVAPVGDAGIPATDSPEDVAAAKLKGTTMDYLTGWHRDLYLHPMLKGEWPEEVERTFAVTGQTLSAEDLRIIHQPLDFLGLNFYHAPTVKADERGRPVVLGQEPGHPRTAFHWDVTPEGIYWLVRFHHEIYGLPILITENGLSCTDWVDLDGKVRDPNRIDYTRRYLLSLRRAAEEGIPLIGYLHWSLMDNFEWAEGYRQRFGMIHVDYQTLKRTVKESGWWYRDVIRSHGAHLDSPLA
jgi:beta-glucosidase